MKANRCSVRRRLIRRRIRSELQGEGAQPAGCRIGNGEEEHALGSGHECIGVDEVRCSIWRLKNIGKHPAFVGSLDR